ncbi:hypothetical protein DEV91_104234 [Phyllobacterium brassicacearum]|nr:hypothetical protein DEV91_104234 [Phyllobacterium brassicacearum]
MLTLTGGQRAQRVQLKDILDQARTAYDDSFVNNTVAA